MAEFNRKSLREIFEAADINVPKDVLGQICDLHTGSIDGMTESVKTLQTRLEAAERERDEYKAKAPKEGQETVAKEDYDKIVKEYGDYKAAQTEKETKLAKTQAYKALLIDAGISDKRADTIIKVTDFGAIELDENGKIKDADTHKQTVQTEYAEFVETTTRRGAHVATPPANTGKGTGMTRDEIISIKDGAARRKAMAENPELFGISAK